MSDSFEICCFKPYTNDLGAPSASPVSNVLFVHTRILKLYGTKTTGVADPHRIYYGRVHDQDDVSVFHSFLPIFFVRTFADQQTL